MTCYAYGCKSKACRTRHAPPKTRIIIETDQPCLVLVLPLPRRVEPLFAPRRVIETTGHEVRDSELPPTMPSIRAGRPVLPVDNVIPLRRVAGQRGVGFLNCVAGLALVALFCEVCKLAGWQ